MGKESKNRPRAALVGGADLFKEVTTWAKRNDDFYTAVSYDHRCADVAYDKSSGFSVLRRTLRGFILVWIWH
jgi:hypothetical protein